MYWLGRRCADDFIALLATLTKAFRRALASLILSPSTSPSQPSRSASAMRAIRLSRISAMRGRWTGLGQSIGQRMQASLN